MNTFSQLLHTLLGIGTQPRDLTFLQVSVRGVIVFIATLIMIRLGSNVRLPRKPRSMLFSWLLSARCWHAPLMDQKPFFRPSAPDLFWCSCIGFSVSRRTIHMCLESWLRENQWCSCKMAGCSGETCFGNTFPNMIWKKICASTRKPRTCLKYKLHDSNAAETSALSKRITSSKRQRN
jgi:hypothetical protein